MYYRQTYKDCEKEDQVQSRGVNEDSHGGLQC